MSVLASIVRLAALAMDRSAPLSSNALSSNTPGTGTIPVNSGGHYQVVTGGGLAWEADRPFVRGNWGYEDGRVLGTHRNITGTADDALFQAARIGARGYRFDVLDGEYELRLGFVEIEHVRPGLRRFDAIVNGNVLFSDLDLVAEAGPLVPVERGLRVHATDGKGIRLQLKARIGETTISSLQLTRL